MSWNSRNLALSFLVALLAIVLLGGHAQAANGPSVVVLPLLDNSAERQEAAWSGHLLADIANRILRATPTVTVPTASAMSAATKSLGSPLGLVATQDRAIAAAKALRVDNIVYGSYRALGADIVVDAHIVNVAQSTETWSDTLNGSVTDIPGLALELADGVANSLTGGAIGRGASREAAPKATQEALIAHGKALGHLDRAIAAEGVDDRETLFAELRAASNELVVAVNMSPDFSSTYQVLLDVSNRILVYNSEDPAALNNQGLAQHRLGLLTEAQETFKRAVSTDPNSAQIRINYANLLADSAVRFAENRERNLADAVTQLTAAQALAPTNPAIYHNLGAVYFEQAKYSEASAVFQKASELAPQDPLPQFGLAMTYKAQKQTQRAREAFQKVIALADGDLKAMAEQELSAL